MSCRRASRIGGTIVELKVRQGDHVDQGQVIATVGDRKLALQINSYAAQVQAAQAQARTGQSSNSTARSAWSRRAPFPATRSISRARPINVALSNLKSIIAQRAVVQQQVKEGKILAPTAGRVITVPVTAGTVVMAATSSPPWPSRISCCGSKCPNAMPVI